MCVSRVGDRTRTGHILGEANQRSEAPERELTTAQCCVLRLLTHLAMLQGAIKNQRVRLQLTYYRYWEDNIMWRNVMLWCFCCRALLTWSTPGPVMFSASCGNILKRTWVCWGRRWIRTRTTRLLLFIWSSTPALSSLEVKLTFRRSSSNTCSLSLSCSEVAPAWGHMWIGAGFDSHLITWKLLCCRFSL